MPSEYDLYRRAQELNQEQAEYTPDWTDAVAETYQQEVKQDTPSKAEIQNKLAETRSYETYTESQWDWSSRYEPVTVEERIKGAQLAHSVMQQNYQRIQQRQKKLEEKKVQLEEKAEEYNKKVAEFQAKIDRGEITEEEYKQQLGVLVREREGLITEIQTYNREAEEVSNLATLYNIVVERVEGRHDKLRRDILVSQLGEGGYERYEEIKARGEEPEIASVNAPLLPKNMEENIETQRGIADVSPALLAFAREENIKQIQKGEEIIESGYEPNKGKIPTSREELAGLLWRAGEKAQVTGIKVSNMVLGKEEVEPSTGFEEGEKKVPLKTQVKEAVRGTGKMFIEFPFYTAGLIEQGLAVAIYPEKPEETPKNTGQMLKAYGENVKEQFEERPVQTGVEFGLLALIPAIPKIGRPIVGKVPERIATPIRGFTEGVGRRVRSVAELKPRRVTYDIETASGKRIIIEGKPKEATAKLREVVSIEKGEPSKVLALESASRMRVEKVRPKILGKEIPVYESETPVYEAEYRVPVEVEGEPIRTSPNIKKITRTTEFKSKLGKKAYTQVEMGEKYTEARYAVEKERGRLRYDILKEGEEVSTGEVEQAEKTGTGRIQEDINKIQEDVSKIQEDVSTKMEGEVRGTRRPPSQPEKTEAKLMLEEPEQKVFYDVRTAEDVVYRHSPTIREAVFGRPILAPAVLPQTDLISLIHPMESYEEIGEREELLRDPTIISELNRGRMVIEQPKIGLGVVPVTGVRFKSGVAPKHTFKPFMSEEAQLQKYQTAQVPAIDTGFSPLEPVLRTPEFNRRTRVPIPPAKFPSIPSGRGFFDFDFGFMTRYTKYNPISANPLGIPTGRKRGRKRRKKRG